MKSFDEYSKTGKDIMQYMEIFTISIRVKYGVSFRGPHHEMARRFLNEIVEFKPARKGDE